MEKTYNKLIRDKIPEIIEADGYIPITRILSDEEYKKELEKKLYEEYLEVLNTKNRKERIEELADMLEIIIYLSMIENSSLDEVIEISKKKKLMRGGFDQKIYLIKEIKKDKQNEK